MLRSQMMGFLRFALFIGIMISVACILAGSMLDIDLTLRYFLITFGIFMLMGVVKGIQNLKDFKWG